jgi:hypothetical protein
MSSAVVHRPRTILPKFNFLLAGGAVVLSIIAITDNVGSNTATATKPAAAVSAAPARGLHEPAEYAGYSVPARGLHEPAEYFGYGVAARGLHEPGEYFQQAPSVGRLLNDVGPVQAFTVAGECGLKISTQC